MTGPEENLALGGMQNWTLFFARSTAVVKQTDGCTLNHDLVIEALDDDDTTAECGLPTACAIPYTSNLNGDNRRLIFKGIVFFSDENIVGYSDAQIKHVFAHEFGHFMSLDDHSSCGGSVMTGNGCTDLVDHGVWPNDLCWPAYNHYYADYYIHC